MNGRTARPVRVVVACEVAVHQRHCWRMKKDALRRPCMLALLVVKMRGGVRKGTYDDCRATIAMAPCRC